MSMNCLGDLKQILIMLGDKCFALCYDIKPVNHALCRRSLRHRYSTFRLGLPVRRRPRSLCRRCTSPLSRAAAYVP